VTLRLNWYEGRTGYLPANWDVLWSLSIEEAFYLGFPLVCLLTRRRSVLAPLLVVLGLSLPVARNALASNSIWMQKAYVPGMSAIAIGVLGALIGGRWQGPPRWLVAAMAALGTTGIAAMLGADIPLYRIFGGGGELLMLSASSLLLILAFHWDNLRVPKRSFRGSGWLRFFGRNSYEVYLTHMFVVLTAVALFRAWGSPWRFADLWYVVTLGLCALLGAIVTHYLTGPSDRALRRLLLGIRHLQVSEPSLSLD
jgi:peptidoglycan/LPS O-acetylase OafA/YrhL